MRRVTLIGAGLAGSLLAIYLPRRDHRVAVYEWRPDLRRVEVPAGRSINLALANRASRRWPRWISWTTSRSSSSLCAGAEALADLSIENYLEMRSTVGDPKYQLKKALAFRVEDRHPERFIPRYSMVMFHRIP